MASAEKWDQESQDLLVLSSIKFHIIQDNLPKMVTLHMWNKNLLFFPQQSRKT
jgi:hypothetical protein